MNLNRVIPAEGLLNNTQSSYSVPFIISPIAFSQIDNITVLGYSMSNLFLANGELL